MSDKEVAQRITQILQADGFFAPANASYVQSRIEAALAERAPLPAPRTTCVFNSYDRCIYCASTRREVEATNGLCMRPEPQRCMHDKSQDEHCEQCVIDSKADEAHPESPSVADVMFDAAPEYYGESEDKMAESIQKAIDTQQSESPSGAAAVGDKPGEKCKARNYGGTEFADCDFPFCGCFTIATKAIETLQECGWGPLEAARGDKPDHATASATAIGDPGRRPEGQCHSLSACLCCYGTHKAHEAVKEHCLYCELAGNPANGDSGEPTRAQTGVSQTEPGDASTGAEAELISRVINKLVSAELGWTPSQLWAIAKDALPIIREVLTNSMPHNWREVPHTGAGAGARDEFSTAMKQSPEVYCAAVERAALRAASEDKK